MIKQDFIAYFDVIKEFYEQQVELGAALHKSLLNGHSIVSFGDKLMTHYVKMLSTLSNIDIDCIEYVLYEGGGTYYDAEGNPYNVITAEDLWEFYNNLT